MVTELKSRRKELFLGLSDELLSKGRLVRFRAFGHCMHPVIKNGDTVIISSISVPDSRPGDILLYKTGRGLTIHRLTSLSVSEGATLTLRSDNPASWEDEVMPDQIIGKVAWIERNGRRINLYGSKSMGLLMYGQVKREFRIQVSLAISLAARIVRKARQILLAD